MHVNVLSITILFSLTILSCKEPNTIDKNPDNINKKWKKKLKETIINKNKIFVEEEDLKIKRYIQRHNYKMVETGTGLRYMIYHHGNGKKIENKDKVTLSYSIELLNGKVCYTKEDIGQQQIIVGNSKAESGLHEGLKYLHNGDKAIFILPPHLAYGFLGDMKKIPPRASIVIKLNVINVEKNNK